MWKEHTPNKIKVYIWKCPNCIKEVRYNELIYGECPHCKSRDIIVRILD